MGHPSDRPGSQGVQVLPVAQPHARPQPPSRGPRELCRLCRSEADPPPTGTSLDGPVGVLDTWESSAKVASFLHSYWGPWRASFLAEILEDQSRCSQRLRAEGSAAPEGSESEAGVCGGDTGSKGLKVSGSHAAQLLPWERRVLLPPGRPGLGTP